MRSGYMCTNLSLQLDARALMCACVRRYIIRNYTNANGIIKRVLVSCVRGRRNAVDVWEPLARHSLVIADSDPQMFREFHLV